MPSKKSFLFSDLTATLSCSIIFLWVSLFLSFKLTDGELTKNFATGGFPIKSFVYPQPPMGNDHVPLEAWGGFAVNALFWFFICSLLFPLLPALNGLVE